MFGNDKLINQEDINYLTDLIKEKNLSEIKIRMENFEFTARANPGRGGYNPNYQQFAPPFAQNAQSAPNFPQTNTQPSAQNTPENSGNVVKSPIVGTFYASPAPDKPPFAPVGSTVKKGDVIMIIESMKLMNEVNSEFDGVVEKVLVNNGDTVEFDQEIMIIK
jgi:acetyl-CoA carboxylase biotin carboxyl carrier protein